MVFLKSTPPTVRKAEVSRQAGYSLSMNTDASLGYSFMGRHGAEATFASRDVGESALVRLMGQMSEGRSGNREDLSLRAKARTPAFPP